MPIKTITRSAVILCLAMAFSGQTAFGESRTAGSFNKPAPASNQKDVQKEPVNGSGGDNRKEAQKQDSFSVDFKTLESHGLLVHTADGSLGRDLWKGTKHSALVKYIPELPAQSPYRTMQQLQRRILLTRTDSALVNQDEKVEPGKDTLTLKIEKLLEMGLYKEALALYAKHPALAYNERFARAGILAALYSGESSLACLESLTLENRFKDVSFWQQISKICDVVLSNAADTKGTHVRFEDSAILDQFAKQKNYSFKPAKLADLEQLRPLEAAVLNAEGKLDLSALKLQGTESLPAHVLTLLMENPSLPEETRFRFRLQAVEAGVLSIESLAGFYKESAQTYFKKDDETSLAAYSKLYDWKRLAYLYHASETDKKDEHRKAIANKALDLVSVYGTAALWPFARFIMDTDPRQLSGEAIRTAEKIIVETDIPLTDAWVVAVHKKIAAQESDLPAMQLSSILWSLKAENAAADSAESVDFEAFYGDLSPQTRAIAGIAHEKLDKSGKFHNYGVDKAYDKHTGLTSSVDYVMPLIGLQEDLEDAEYEKRLGEVILLSSIALRDAPPEKISPELFQEVIDGLVTVGLTEEARSLAREVVLGLSIQ